MSVAEPWTSDCLSLNRQGYRDPYASVPNPIYARYAEFTLAEVGDIGFRCMAGFDNYLLIKWRHWADSKTGVRQPADVKSTTWQLRTGNNQYLGQLFHFNFQSSGIWLY